jgi:hypothetical protein
LCLNHPHPQQQDRYLVVLIASDTPPAIMPEWDAYKEIVFSNIAKEMVRSMQHSNFILADRSRNTIFSLPPYHMADALPSYGASNSDIPEALRDLWHGTFGVPSLINLNSHLCRDPSAQESRGRATVASSSF